MGVPLQHGEAVGQHKTDLTMSDYRVTYFDHIIQFNAKEDAVKCDCSPLSPRSIPVLYLPASEGVPALCRVQGVGS